MAAKLIDGKSIAKSMTDEIASIVSGMPEKPGLAVVLVGDNPASQVYVRNKERMCKDVGFYSESHVLDADIDELRLLALIDKLNESPYVHGMLVQLPLPKHIEEKLIIDSILPHKDADGFNPINMGNLLIGNNMIVPATPAGVIKLIESTGIGIEGKHAVVLGRSNIVGKPVSVLLQQKNATVTMCHSKTAALMQYTKSADILVCAIGKERFVTKEMVKPGAVVIDVGMNRGKDGKLYGDVDFDSVKEICGHITPVPGGVGPMTIACLMENTMKCFSLGKRING